MKFFEQMFWFPCFKFDLNCNTLVEISVLKWYFEFTSTFFACDLVVIVDSVESVVVETVVVVTVVDVVDVVDSSVVVVVSMVSVAPEVAFFVLVVGWDDGVVFSDFSVKIFKSSFSKRCLVSVASGVVRGRISIETYLYTIIWLYHSDSTLKVKKCSSNVALSFLPVFWLWDAGLTW